jgi:hypothetical protein
MSVILPDLNPFTIIGRIEYSLAIEIQEENSLPEFKLHSVKERPLIKKG